MKPGRAETIGRDIVATGALIVYWERVIAELARAMCPSR